MKTNIFNNESLKLISFHTTKRFLNKDIQLHSFDKMDNYYYINQKKISHLSNYKDNEK